MNAHVEPDVLAAAEAAAIEAVLKVRRIEAVSIDGVEPGALKTSGPIYEWVDPTELLVDEAYQRGLSSRSLKLIRRIVASWDWRKFKPPVVALTARGLEVIDGQHTAIAAASHPGIEKIPVGIVDAAELRDRAAAFIGQNRDRLGITAMQLHVAAVQAGDEEAMTIEQVTRRAGVTLLKASRTDGWNPGESMAVNAIKALIERRGAMKARMVLEVLVKSGVAPIKAQAIKAADHLMHEPEYAMGSEDLIAALSRSDMEDDERDAAVFSASKGVPLWKGLVAQWGKRSRKRS